MKTLYKLNKYIHNKESGNLNANLKSISVYTSQSGKYISDFTDLTNSIIIEISQGIYYITIFLDYYNQHYERMMINFLPVRNIKDTKITSIKFNSYKCKEIDYYYSDSVKYKFESPKKKVIFHKLDGDYSRFMVYEYNKLKRITMIKTYDLYNVYKFKFEEDLVQIDIIRQHSSTRYVKC